MGGLISRFGSVLWVLRSVALLPVPAATALWAVPLPLTNVLAKATRRHPAVQAV